MKKLLAIALIVSTPAAAQQSDVVCAMTNDCSCQVQATRDVPQSRGFKIAKRESTQTTALKRIRADLVAKNPKDKLIAVIDKALAQ